MPWLALHGTLCTASVLCRQSTLNLINIRYLIRHIGQPKNQNNQRNNTNRKEKYLLGLLCFISTWVKPPSKEELLSRHWDLSALCTWGTTIYYGFLQMFPVNSSQRPINIVRFPSPFLRYVSLKVNTYIRLRALDLQRLV